MADRGRPISIATRLEIRDRRTQETPEPVRKVAESLGVSPATVQKYSGQKFGTKPLKERRN